MLAVFTRHSFGTRAFDPHGFIAFFFLLSMAGAYPVFKPYFFLWVFAMAGHR